MTIGVMWEFFEYGVDKVLKYDMQKDKIVTSISSVALNPEGENVPVVIDDIVSTSIFYLEDGTLKGFSVDDGYLDISLFLIISRRFYSKF